ncbi:MAG: GntR family transcriptional regulator [Clostridiaceae bacterium]|nr:GntR family transcriptional regulator [Eubacteriales bacterium]
MKSYALPPREMAIESIEAYILKNGLKPNDKLPPEREMCRMWGINRTTLRNALARMSAAGKLCTVWGSGTRLLPRMNRTLQDLQGFSEYAREQGMQPGARLLSFSPITCDKRMAKRFAQPEGGKLYRITRLRLVDGMPIMLETAYINASLAPGLEEHDLVNGSLFSMLKDVYGLQIDHGWEKASVTFATVEEAESLGIEEGAPAFWIVSETYGDDGALIEYCRTIGRSDMITMSSTLYWQEG